MKLKTLVSESWLQEKKKLTKEERAAFLERVKKFNAYGKKIFRQQQLSEVSRELAEMCKLAEVLTLSEVDESFDKITVERNMKELANTAKLFDKTSKECDLLENRMKMLYDDMGKLLERYYDIDDEELDEVSTSQLVDNGNGTKPYDNWKSDDMGSINEETPEQKVEKNHGLHPYDNFRGANDVAGQVKTKK